MQKIKNIRIVCLPVAGDADPTQLLMINGLNETSDINAFNGINDRFFGIIRSAIKFKPNFIHFDWIESYYIRRNRILTYLNLPLFFLQIIICRYLLRIRLAWTIHNILPHNRDQLKLKYFVLRSFSKMVHFIRVLSPESIDAFAQKYNVNKNKIHFIGAGDYTEYYPNTISKFDARQNLNIPTNALVLLTLGSVKKYKGIPQYLQLMQKISHPDLYILIVGKCIDAELDLEIKSLTNSRIIYKNNFIEINDLQLYYNAADLIVLPFIEIENSGSLVMAMGFKKPIIAPRSNVLNYRLKYQQEFLYEKGALAETINKSLKISGFILNSFGENNFSQLKEYKWADFGLVFLQYAKHGN